MSYHPPAMYRESLARRLFTAWFCLAVGLISSDGQVENADSPIVFSNGNTVDTATLAAEAHSDSSDPVIDSPVQITGAGGTLEGDSQVTFLDPFSGTGVLTLDLNSADYVNIGNIYYEPLSTATFSNGLVLESGNAIFNFGTSTINGSLSVTGNSALEGGDFGGIVFTSNNISGVSGATLSVGGQDPALSFTGSGFTFNSSINGAEVIMGNSSGTQTFGGTLGTVERVASGGTSVITGSTGEVLAYGGNITLTGANGALGTAFGTELFLQGGTLTLDNTLVNNNSRLGSSAVGYDGGGLVLLGVNGGATNQQVAAPEFSEGLNTIAVEAGTGAGSSATLTFGGRPSVGSDDSGSVDFQGLSSNSHVIFTGENAGPLGAWATVNGTDFATYDTTNGVETMSTTGRPSQVSAGTSTSYVLATSAQNTLTSNVTVAGVTMDAGALNLGGQTLMLGGWIQNDSAGSITNGTIEASYSPIQTIYFTTNANLGIQAAIDAGTVVKNGGGTMTLSGSVASTNGALPQFFVNAGTLALDVSTPIQSLEGASTFLVGQSAGAPDSAVLSLSANNQFISTGGSYGNFVGVQVQTAGQFNLNGYNANTSFLQVNGGVVDMGGATLTTGGIVANAVSSPGQIQNGILNIVASNDPYGPGGGQGNFNVSNVSSEDGLDITAQVTSTGTITKSGNGTVVLSNASNSFGNGTVGLVLDAGTVALANSGAVGSANQQIQWEGGALRADSVGALTLTNPTQGVGVITSGSDIVLAGGFSQTVNSAGFYAADTLTVDGYSISGTNYAATNSGTGTLILAGTASGSSTGTFSQESGTLAFGSSQPLPTGMQLDYSAGIIEAVNGPQTIANGLTISGDITFDGSQALTFGSASGNTVDNGSGQVTRYLYVNGSGPVTINNLTNSESSSLVTGGTGTLVLSGTPSGFVSTHVNTGTLRVSNTGAASASLGVTTVISSGTLGGVGSISGGLTTVQSGGTLDPGSAPESVGTLKFQSGLTLASGSSLDFDLGDTTGSDLIQITGGTLTAPSAGKVTVNLNNSGDFGIGTFTLMSWTNSSTAATADFSLGSTISGYQESLLVTNNKLELTATAVAPEPKSALLFLVGLGLVWSSVRRGARPPYSSARARVKFVTLPLAALYELIPQSPPRPDADERLMMEPFVLRR
jgi:fibronectin-binding autotransporter adhesin